LCPVDFSDTSRHALQVAADLARRLRVELTVLHVHPLPVETGPEGGLVVGPLMNEARYAAEQELEAWRREAAVLAGKEVTVKGQCALGSAADDIVRIARAKGAGAIVMGTHGRTGLARALMGSVAERVVRTAPCPVLTVHPEPVGEAAQVEDSARA
jgi:nucleotide-binding universal stress UspA family protein